MKHVGSKSLGVLGGALRARNNNNSNTVRGQRDFNVDFWSDVGNCGKDLDVVCASPQLCKLYLQFGEKHLQFGEKYVTQTNWGVCVYF